MTYPISKASDLPWFRRPITLLFLMAFGMPIAFSTWFALLNNFVIEAAQFDGVKIGWLHSVREIPGFLAIGVIAVIIFIREQTLALIALVALGVATAVTAQFPTFYGLLATTMISSIGYHYYETVNQSLQLQWLGKDRAPQILGWIVAAGSASSLLVYLVIVIGWQYFGLTYQVAYFIGGGVTAAIALYCWIGFPKFEGDTPQLKKMVLRQRYWLYYALQFMSGARRQIFLVFAAFMMVEKFGFAVHQVTALFVINYVANIVMGPVMGWVVTRVGERRALIFEYSGLFGVFCGLCLHLLFRLACLGRRDIICA